MTKAICLISGGIDSPLAAYEMSKSLDIIPLHFSLYPFYCEESFSITMRTLERLYEKTEFDEMLIFPWGNILKYIFNELENESYACVFCRKTMFNVASKICDKIGADSLVTGESLGQKASQTLENLRTTSYDINYPIHRPLIGLDKDKIVKKSKEEGLFFQKHTGCCNATPDQPRTKSRPEAVQDRFKGIKMKEKINEEMGRLEVIDLNETSFHIAAHNHLKKVMEMD